jgi:microcystin degradation protein MlrC
MRIAVALIDQETNTFSPVPTTLEDFESFGYLVGDSVPIDAQRPHGLGGFARVAAERGGVELVPLLFALAGPGGRVDRQAFDAIVSDLEAQLRRVGPVDALYLELHGAMALSDHDDPDGLLLQRTRELLGPETWIIASLDHHANVTTLQVACADVLIGHRTQPHDPPHTGEESARALFRLIDESIRPTMALRKAPMVTHQEQYLTQHPPMKIWFDLARQMESRPGVVSTSTFPMQPWLDVDEGGWGSVVITDDNPQLAAELAEELTSCVWGLRDQFMVTESVSVEEAVRRAVSAESGLVVLSDTGDSMLGGAAGDSNVILAELLRRPMDRIALVPLVDAPAALAATAAGIGATLELDLGRAADPTWGSPVRVTADVVAITDGAVEAPGTWFEGMRMGRSALLRVGTILVSVTERRGLGGVHPAVWTHFGVDPSQAQCVVVKTASNFQFFADMTSEVIRVDTPGHTQSRVADFEWNRLPRPAFPLDADAALRFDPFPG